MITSVTTTPPPMITPGLTTPMCTSNCINRSNYLASTLTTTAAQITYMANLLSGFTQVVQVLMLFVASFAKELVIIFTIFAYNCMYVAGIESFYKFKTC